MDLTPMSASARDLVVDDHSDLRDALMVLLEHEGFQVADASNRARRWTTCDRASP